jgi:hypothetical protein
MKLSVLSIFLLSSLAFAQTAPSPVTTAPKDKTVAVTKEERDAIDLPQTKMSLLESQAGQVNSDAQKALNDLKVQYQKWSKDRDDAIEKARKAHNLNTTDVFDGQNFTFIIKEAPKTPETPKAAEPAKK